MGINARQDDESAKDSGALYVFTRSHQLWSSEAYLKASNSQVGDRLGDIYFGGLDVSDDGNSIVAGSYDNSSATGINGNQRDNRAIYSGAVYLY